MQVLCGSHEVALGREIGGVDDQRIPFPSAPRGPVPLTDAAWKVPAPVQGNDASFVDKLRGQDHVPGSLQNLGVTEDARSIVTAKPWHAERDATPIVADLLRALWKTST